MSDRIVVTITAKPGESFIDRMIALVEGASRQKTPNEIALNILLASLTIVFLMATVTLQPFAIYSGAAQSLVVLVHQADPEHVYAALSDALLTPDELENPELWAEWVDPFGQYHEDPCESDSSAIGADDDRRAAQ